MELLRFEVDAKNMTEWTRSSNNSRTSTTPILVLIMFFHDSSAMLAVEPLVAGPAMMVDMSSLLFFHTRSVTPNLINKLIMC